MKQVEEKLYQNCKNNKCDAIREEGWLFYYYHLPDGTICKDRSLYCDNDSLQLELFKE